MRISVMKPVRHQQVLLPGLLKRALNCIAANQDCEVDPKGDMTKIDLKDQGTNAVETGRSSKVVSTVPLHRSIFSPNGNKAMMSSKAEARDQMPLVIQGIRFKVNYN
ncbi:hypothetical protein AT5G28410 [Arabidopsis thaliana]|uniref:Uncharacterized protein n=1 Tax=Arabidopsis thaliana TaxID=3702 RepID=F4K741_ARATH|nr:uncharacterized protein AT5G28410 [Arabidopsis thaliana]AED93797.1 hypothetical protein AT5G28410 [Arabidopsis thaliana]|eukprot:NP_198193.1 hypothetical protein AT5G28410 [Arabidopsis thaliana]